MTWTDLYPRHAARPLAEALAHSPAVLVHGPRQCGKTTLARSVGGPLGHSYVSFDDDVARRTAETDPAGFVADLPERVVLDEVQRVPGLFAALKTAIDRHRIPGRFILTGSSNVLLVPKLTDSLAGRMHVLRLHPLSQNELARQVPAATGELARDPAAHAEPGRSRTPQAAVGFLDSLFDGGPRFQAVERLGAELADRIVAGGYPAALVRPKGRWRTEWYRSYVETIVARDVRDLARIRHFDALPKLLSVAAAGTAQLFNATKLASTFGVSRVTIADYVALLERVFSWSESSPGTVAGSSDLPRRRSSTLATPGWRAPFSALTSHPSPPTGRCWATCWKPSSTRSFGAWPQATAIPTRSTTTATRTVPRWTS